jgi:hypothetical protein
MTQCNPPPRIGRVTDAKEMPNIFEMSGIFHPYLYRFTIGKLSCVKPGLPKPT